MFRGKNNEKNAENQKNGLVAIKALGEGAFEKVERFFKINTQLF